MGRYYRNGKCRSRKLERNPRHWHRGRNHRGRQGHLSELHNRQVDAFR